MEGIAGAVSLAGDAKAAARLLGAASAARQAAGAPLPLAERGDIDRITARTPEAFGARDFTAGVPAGTALYPVDVMSTVDGREL